jgi:transposase
MLLAQVQQLAAEVAALRARLDDRNKHSGNSSKPPSSDHPHGPKAHADKAGQAERTRPSDPPAEPKRPRGGQKGHPGTTRELLPVEAVQAVVPCVPTECTHCHTALPGAAAPGDPDPIREQVWELPPIVWEVTEFQRHARTCPDCGRRTWGERPADAPTGCLGFRAQGAVAVLTGGAQLTRRVARTLLHELLGLPVALGTLPRVEATVSAALAAADAEIAAAVRAAPVVNCDETPWREPGLKPWLWVATTPEATLFRIAPQRDGEAFARLLPPRPGQIKGTDRFAVYTSRIPVEEHAICWAHLARDFAAWTGRSDVAGTIARWLAEQTAQLFAHWQAFKGGGRDRLTLATGLAPVQAAIEVALAWGAASGVPKFSGLCRNLLDRWEALWTFARVEGVEPTNNAAERAVRQGVLWRKVSLFTQSAAGRTYVERVLTVKTTLRQRGENLLEFVTASLQAARTGGPAPSALRPSPA